MQKNKLILGSQSPRRKELLAMTFVPYDIVVSGIEEHSDKENVEDLVMDLAEQKAKAVFTDVEAKYSSPIVLGSDTIVVIDNKVLGKPKTREEAKQMLTSLSGRDHIVLTGVSLVSEGKVQNFFDKTYVSFCEITEDLLELYLDTGDSMDKAGAYGIQAQALSFIKKIDGSYSNVVGLPVNKVIDELKLFIGDSTPKWRENFE